MPQQIERLGCKVLYPDSWKVEENDDQESFTLENPSGSFFTVTRCSDIDDAMDSVRQAMSEEYEITEEEDFEKQLAGHSMFGINQRFVYLDLIITSQLLQVEGNDQQFLVQIQGEDRDLDKNQQVFDAMLVSMLQSL